MEGNGQFESALPDKNLFRIGEVSRLTSTKPFVLRFWETEFPMLQPVKSPKGHRLYRREDIETVLVIKRLLYDEGFTIAGSAAPPERSGRRAERFGPVAQAQMAVRERRGIRAAGSSPAICHAEPQDAAGPARFAPLIVDGSGIRVIR